MFVRGCPADPGKYSNMSPYFFSRCFILAVTIVVLMPLDSLALNLVRIKIYPEHVGIFTSVGKQQFVAFGFRADGSSVNITKLVDWKSSKPNIVTISDTGMARVVSGKTFGQAKISCSYPKKKKTPRNKLAGPYLLLLRELPEKPETPDPLLGPYLLLLGADPAPLKALAPASSQSTANAVPYRKTVEIPETLMLKSLQQPERSEYVTLPKN